MPFTKYKKGLIMDIERIQYAKIKLSRAKNDMYIARQNVDYNKIAYISNKIKHFYFLQDHTYKP